MRSTAEQPHLLHRIPRGYQTIRQGQEVRPHQHGRGKRAVGTKGNPAKNVLLVTCLSALTLSMFLSISYGLGNYFNSLDFAFTGLSNFFIPLMDLQLAQGNVVSRNAQALLLTIGPKPSLPLRKLYTMQFECAKRFPKLHVPVQESLSSTGQFVSPGI